MIEPRHSPKIGPRPFETGAEPGVPGLPATAARSRWPMTSAASRALETEIEPLMADVRRLAERSVHSGEERDRVAFEQAARRLVSVRAVLGSAQIVDDPAIAAIGRRVTLREEDGALESYALVIPGDGDPAQGWVSVDSPLGAAMLGARPGDRVEVVAPAGVRTVTVTAIS